MKRKFCFLAISVSVMLSASAQDTKTWLNFKDSVFKVKAKYPPDWELKTTNPSAIAVFKSPLESVTDEFRQNVNIVTRKLANSNIRVKDAIPTVLESLKEKFTDFVLISSKSITYSGTSNAIELKYKGTHTEGTSIAIIQRLAVKGKLMITVTYTAQDGEPDAFLNTGKTILNNISF